MIPAKLDSAVAIAAALAVACGPSPQPSPSAAPPTPTPDPRPVVLFLGTSLTAGYGLDPSEAYPALLQRSIDAAGLRYRVVNAGVSGETSAGALERIDWVLRQEVAVLVIETGANDGLRGFDPGEVRSNIRSIIARARGRQPAPRILLVGMRALENMGAAYGKGFRSLYPELARENGLALVPFLLKGVAGVPGLNQDDGVHPNAEGQRRIAETVWPYLLPLLRPPPLP
jgi:acyl-CoA thioesterase-1